MKTAQKRLLKDIFRWTYQWTKIYSFRDTSQFFCTDS